MKLHSTVIEKLVRVYDTYGGHRNESRLKTELSKIELVEYKRQSGESILVSAEDVERAKESTNG